MTRPAGIYRLETSEDLQYWRRLDFSPVAGDGGSKEAVIADSALFASRNRFFRVVEALPVFPATRPLVEDFGMGGPAVNLEWTSTPDREYRLLFSSDLRTWQALGDSPADPLGGSTRRAFVLPSDAGSKNFFWVEDVTAVPITRREVVPATIRMVAAVRDDRTYRLVASDNLVEWDDVLARDLTAVNGRLVFEMTEPLAPAHKARFFRFEEE
jgi:hypothetical protein